MKKILSFILAGAAAALALSSCQKEVAPAEPEATVKTVNFNAMAPSVKAVLGEKDGTSYPTTWSANDTKVNISLNYGSAKDGTLTPSADGSSATISVDIAEPETAPDSYTFYALSPSSAAVSVSSEYSSWTVLIPTAQTPGTKTPDEGAMILAAKSESFDAMPTTSVNLPFSHVTAYLDFSILNLKDGVEVESIDLTFGTNVAGRWFYYPEDGSMLVNSGAASINLATSSTENLFVAVVPVAASVLGGTDLKVTVNASDNTKLVKTVTLPATASFVAGKVNTLKVDFNGIGSTDADIYTKVTSYDELTAGSKVIIAAAGTTAFAISTTQNTNNRAEAAVTKSEDGSQIIGPGDAVEIFTLEAGTADNTVAFLATTTVGYIYAANGDDDKSGNWLRTKTAKDANGSFAITLGTVGNGDVIVANANDRGHMRYNASNNPPIFSCYASNSSVKALPSIYKLAGTGSGDPLVAAPVEYNITISPSENGTVTASTSTAFEGDEITLTVTPAEGYTLDVLTVTNVTTSEAVAVTDNKFTMPASDVTVSATFAAPVEYSITISDSENGTVTASASTAFEGDEITLTVTPAEGYALDVLTVTNVTTSEEVAVTGNKFTMPASDVTVSATFREKGEIPDPEKFTFSEMGYANAQEVTSVSGTNCTITFDKGSNSNAPKYYNTGSAVRAYGGNSFTVSSSLDIKQINLTFSSGEGSNEITTDVVSYQNGTWSGQAKSVTFTIGGTTGHRRISAIEVVY